MIMNYLQRAACLWLLMGVFTLAANAQNAPLRFGQLDKAEFDAVKTLADTSAEAYVLYDFGETTFFIKGEELWMEQLIHERIYIRKKSAYDRATVRQTIRSAKTGGELLLDIRGMTHNLVDGKLVSDKMGKDAIFVSRLDEQTEEKKFTLPNVREGSIIEYTYKRQTPFSVDYNPSVWTFQNFVPVRWSEYRITIPDAYYYKIVLGGYLSLYQREMKPTRVGLSAELAISGMAYRFVVKDAPAFRNEPYLATERDHLSRIEFDLANINIPDQFTRDYSLTWEALDKTLLDNEFFGKQLNRSGLPKEVLAPALAKADSLERLTAVYDLVRRTIRWNGQYSLFSAGSKKVYDKREGDAADINLILIGALREAGFDAQPLILSTRSHGKVNETLPLIRKFNYVVAYVALKGQPLLLDATDPFRKPGMLPIHCLNGSGRLVRPTGGRFVPLAPTERDTETDVARLTLTPEGTLTGSYTKTYGGYSGWSVRRKLAEQGKDKFLGTLYQSKKTWQVERTELRNLDDSQQPIILEHQLRVSDVCQVAGDRMYLQPMIAQAKRENPFKATERKYPVDLATPIEESFTGEYKLPAGYEVEQVPASASLTLPNNSGRFSYQVSVQNGTLTVNSRLSLRQPQYSVGDYAALREFFAQLVAKQAEQVVLRKQLTASGK